MDGAVSTAKELPRKRDLDRAGGAAKKRSKAKGGSKSEQAPRGRKYTVTLALPGSIVANAQTAELKTYLCGQIARAAVVFNIDEIVVFSDRRTPGDSSKPIEGRFQGAVKGANFDADVFLARILQYLETPQYLRKLLFPVHKDLRYAGLLNPLDCPHHPRMNAFPAYREGVVVDTPPDGGQCSHVNVGLGKDIVIDRRLQKNVRVTVKVDKSTRYERVVRGVAVSANEPREEAGIYWGYSTRIASGLTAVMEEGPYGGYDLTIGTSERGALIEETDFDQESKANGFEHLLVVLGGVAGLEDIVQQDQ